MDALRVGTRFRVHALVEWLIAAAFLCATLAVAAMILQELRGTPVSRRPSESRPAVASIPAAIPAGDFERSARSYGAFRTVGDPFYNPNLTLSATD